MNKNTKEWIYIILAYVCIVVAVGGGIYVGLYIMFVKGVIVVVHGICSHPVSASGIAWGIVRMMLAAPVGALIICCCYFGKFFIDLSDKVK